MWKRHVLLSRGEKKTKKISNKPNGQGLSLEVVEKQFKKMFRIDFMENAVLYEVEERQ